MPKIKTLVLQFANNISAAEIPQFRGEANGVVYRYPRIQYKRLHQKAAIVCVNEGVEAIHDLFSLGNFLYHIGRREEEMLIQSVDTFETDLDFCNEMRGYRLRNWLPLNSENFDVLHGNRLFGKAMQRDIICAIGERNAKH